PVLGASRPGRLLRRPARGTSRGRAPIIGGRSLSMGVRLLRTSRTLALLARGDCPSTTPGGTEMGYEIEEGPSRTDGIRGQSFNSPNFPTEEPRGHQELAWGSDLISDPADADATCDPRTGW